VRALLNVPAIKAHTKHLLILLPFDYGYEIVTGFALIDVYASCESRYIFAG